MLPHGYNKMLGQSDPTKICYYEYYPNSSTGNSATEEPVAASFQSKHESKSQDKVSDVSQNLSSSHELPGSCNDVLCESDPTKIYYYESYPNSTVGNSTTTRPDLVPTKICYYESYPNSSIDNSTAEELDATTSFRSKHESESLRKAIDDDVLYQFDQTTLCYYESYPNASTGSTIMEEPDVASLQSKHESKSHRTASDVSQSSSTSLELPDGYDDEQWQSVPTNICYYESYPNSSVSNSTTEEHDVLYQFDQINICYYESYPNASTGDTTIEEPDVALQSKHESKSKRRANDGSQGLRSSPQFRQSAARQTTPSSSSLKAPPSSKPSLSALHNDSPNQQTKACYIQKGTSPLYMIPKDIEDLIKKGIVPDVLLKPLSSSTYKDYFATLLYAEDFYIEKWSEFKLFNVTLELQEAAIYNKLSKNKNLKESEEKMDKTFVAFEIDSVPEKQPFLLSRDFVSARCLGNKSKQFQGLIYRVVKSNIVLVEFEEDFYSQHHSNSKYDISFSFNRVCLKRAHHAVVVAAASDPLIQNYLFPDCASRKNISASAALNYRFDLLQNPAVRHILSFQGSPPYLVKGSLCVTGNQLSKTGLVVLESLLQIYKNSPESRILICAPINKTCDVLMASLKKEIPETEMFRANAAFREIDGVPLDILPLCPYKGECFTCPSLEKLMQFRVIFSTFVSSYRLHNEGIKTGHFTHIFLVDASSATEPETMIALSNLADEKTSVILTGGSNNRPSWVRSDMARKNGLSMSYFERLCENKTYKSLEPAFITRV